VVSSSTEKRDTVVVGASAGGIEALRGLLPALDSSEASVFVVVHLAANGPSLLDRVLAPRAAGFAVAFARDGETVEPRRIYLAPPDRHLLLEDGRVKLWRGPMENHSRPAIDPLFRSAAIARRGRVIAAVLSGFLDDGSAGLLAVKRCGGKAFVQALDEAAEPEMPTRAAENLGRELDGALPVAELGARIAQLLGTPAPEGSVPDDIQLEMRMQLGEVNGITELGSHFPPVPVSCPECGGPLWGITDGRVQRYRCHTGHAFGLDSLLSSQSTQIEQALWAAIKGLEQRSQMLTNLSREVHVGARASFYKEESQRLLHHAHTLREVLLNSLGGSN
jgi:two-component system, chemotaxis family, protein-glutamate methylesterase/glutaminase